MPIASRAMRIFLGVGFILLFAAKSLPAQTASARCVECHTKTTPNIVSDWKLSKHSGAEITCVSCHGDQHSSVADVAKVEIPTPETCSQCHEAQVLQFKKGKHAMAWASMKAMPTIHWQPVAMTQGEKGCGGCHKIGDKTVTEIVSFIRTAPALSSRCPMRRVPYPSHVFGGRSTPAAGLPDLSYGV